MLICPSCHAKVTDHQAWMMCPDCGFAFEDDDGIPTARDLEAISDPPPEEDLVYPSEMTEEDLEPDSELAVHARPPSIAAAPPLPEAPPLSETSPPSETPAPRPKSIARELNLDPRAKRLLEAAEQDRARGDLASALTNLKLAVSFAPQSVELRQMVHELARTQPAPRPASRVVSQKPPVDKKTGDLDETIGALKKSLATSKKKTPPPEPKRSASSVLGLFKKK